MSDIGESTVVGYIRKYNVTGGDIHGAYTVVNTEALGRLRKLADQVRAGDIADALAALAEVPALVAGLTVEDEDEDDYEVLWMESAREGDEEGTE